MRYGLPKVIIGVTPEYLTELIKSCIREVYANSDITQVDQGTPCDSKGMLTQKQAAKFLGVTLPSIIKWRKDGKIPYHRILGTRKICYLKSELRNCSKQE